MNELRRIKIREDIRKLGNRIFDLEEKRIDLNGKIEDLELKKEKLEIKLRIDARGKK